MGLAGVIKNEWGKVTWEEAMTFAFWLAYYVVQAIKPVTYFRACSESTKWSDGIA